MRSTLSILLLLSVAVVLINSSMRPNQAVVEANKILNVMDHALESKDFKQFLAMHSADFKFKFCNSTGKSVDDLKKILETDAHMSKVSKSKHFRKGPIKGPARHTEKFNFVYEEYLLLENNELYKTEGYINFVAGPNITSAVEKCPIKIF